MLDFQNIRNIEDLFTEMEPTGISGQPFTPSLHPEEIILEDQPHETEDEEEVISLASIRKNIIPFQANVTARYSFVSQLWTRPGFRKSHPTKRAAIM